MIEELRIRNLGVIGEAHLPLGPGFTALTGETGAGKTMVVTALGLLMGERVDTGALRKGADQAVVEGHWLVPAGGEVALRALDAGALLDEAGAADDGVAQAALVLGRSVSAEGRSRASVGGRSTPAGVLAELGEQLVVVHGQSEQLRLKSAAAQRQALDRFGGERIATALAEYGVVYERWVAARAELDSLVAERDAREREAEELRVAVAEVEAAEPQPGEDVLLAARAERLTNLEDLRLAAAAAHEALTTELDDSPDALSLVEAARRALERVTAHDAGLSPLAEGLASISYQLSDLAGQLAGYLSGLDADGAGELEAIQERRALLGELIRRHGPTLDEVIAFLDTGSARLLELDNDTSRIDELTASVAADHAEAVRLAGVLSELRAGLAQRLAAAVTEELRALAMPDAALTVAVEQREELTATGVDQVSILLRPHPGSEPRPLGRGASGGELSRVMLAIEVVLAASDPVPTFVFDEVDAGVGGSAAIEIGKRLARLSRSAQVIVVTHLAQVAAFASNHLRVVKSTDGEITASSVQQLGGPERTEELARMLSGLAESESGLAHARELLDTAQSLV